jgi:hypothetical protein
MTCLVTYDDKGVIIDTPPILRKFIGQSYLNVIRWMSGQSGFKKVSWSENGDDQALLQIKEEKRQ